MSTLGPPRESIRRAVVWISEVRKEDPTRGLVTLVEEAATRFDLGPVDEEFLWKALSERPKE